MKLDYASAIISLRIKLNLSQMALAELLGVSFTSVNRWENGKYAYSQRLSSTREFGSWIA